MLEEELEHIWEPSELGVLGRRPALLEVPCWIAAREGLQKCCVWCMSGVRAIRA